MVAHSVSSSRAVATVCPSVASVQNEELMAEIETITEQLTQTRNTLWETQDRLRATETKAQQLEMHVTELVAERKRDGRRVKQIQEENARNLEEQSKLRESLEMMKKVFIRNQLKFKEDQESMALIQEERDLLLLENEKLRKNVAVDSAEIEKSKDATNKSDTPHDSQKNERLLSDALERSRNELKEYKILLLEADYKIRKLKKELYTVREGPGLLDLLGSNVVHLMEGMEGIEDREGADSDIVYRAFFDEDLEESLTRGFLQNLNCTAISNGLETTKQRGCTYNSNIGFGSFDDEGASSKYSLMGFRRGVHE